MADAAPFLYRDDNTEVVINAARSRDNGQEAVIATDAVGRILYWNDRAALLYGWRPDEVLGRNILDVTPTRRSGDAAAQILEDMRNGKEWSGEFIVRHRDGSPMLARIQNSVIRDGNVVVGVVGVSRLSARKTLIHDGTTPPSRE